MPVAQGQLPRGYASNGGHATSGAQVIRALVVDDEALIRTGFTHFLDRADDIAVVAAVPGGRAVRWGAADFLLKDTDPEHSPHLVGTSAVREPGAVRLAARLTYCERAVLVLLAEGLANTDIGEQLHLSTGTVTGHVTAVLGKLQVSSRAQAILIAERAGLLTRPQDEGVR